MIRIADPTKIGPALEELRTMLGVSRRSLARAVGNATHRDTDSVNSQIWAWERSGRSPHSGSLAAVLDELGWGLAFVPLDTDAPSAPAVTPQTAENGSGVVGYVSGDSDGPTGLSGPCPCDFSGRTCPRHGTVI